MGGTYPLGGGETTFGSGPAATVPLHGAGIAPAHVGFRRRPDGGYQVEDLGRRAGRS